MTPIRSLFLASCRDVATALADPLIHAAWDEPSVLEQQTVGSVAAHVGRGCWIALRYLDGDEPPGPVDFGSAADYFAKLIEAATTELHAGIRERGAEGAAAGAQSVQQQLLDELDVLEARLAGESEDRLVSVFGDNTMYLDDYLETRIVEQVVHLDDLAQSIDREPFTVPAEAETLVIACGADIGRRRFGSTAMIRTPFRNGPDDGGGLPLPVL